MSTLLVGKYHYANELRLEYSRKVSVTNEVERNSNIWKFHSPILKMSRQRQTVGEVCDHCSMYAKLWQWQCFRIPSGSSFSVSWTIRIQSEWENRRISRLNKTCSTIIMPCERGSNWEKLSISDSMSLFRYRICTYARCDVCCKQNWYRRCNGVRFANQKNGSECNLYKACQHSNPMNICYCVLNDYVKLV